MVTLTILALESPCLRAHALIYKCWNIPLSESADLESTDFCRYGMISAMVLVLNHDKCVLVKAGPTRKAGFPSN